MTKSKSTKKQNGAFSATNTTTKRKRMKLPFATSTPAAADVDHNTTDGTPNQENTYRRNKNGSTNNSSSSLSSNNKKRRKKRNIPSTSTPKTNATKSSSHNNSQNNASAAEQASQLQLHQQSLPIYQVKSLLQNVTEKHNVLILVGETGSGKTTQVPQFISQWSQENRVVVTQPRRVAAVSVSKRVSQEMDSKLGHHVGYKIRFEDKYSKQHTKVLFVTDGMLLREAQLDPLLNNWNWIILDEAHERTLHTDILFGVIKRALLEREKRYKEQQEKLLAKNASSEEEEESLEDSAPLIQPLKVIVMSATLEASSFSKFFFKAPIIYVAGRQHPVDVFFSSVPQKDYMDSVVRCVLQIHMDESLDGDILTFLTGQDEILAIQSILEEKAKLLPATSPKLIVYPLFAALPQKKQMEAFTPAPPGCRKVIVSTNIAETSITIPGIKYVVDSGVVKSRQYHADRAIENLQVIPISKANARQRTGRAGREQPGKCYRLFTEDQYEGMEDFAVPEIQRSNLATVVLQMKSMGIDDIVNFDFLDPPPKNTLEKSLQYLFLLGAVDKKLKLTNLGNQMAKFPLDPMYSLALLKATEYGCVQEMLTILSMLSVESIFYSPATHREEANKAKKKFSSRYGDHLTYLYVYKAYVENRGNSKFCQNNFIHQKNMKKVLEIRKQLTRYMQQLNIEVESSCGKNLRLVRKCLLSAGYLNVAMKQAQSRTYRSLQNSVEVKLHPSSVIQDLPTSKLPEFVVFNVLMQTSEYYIRDVTAMEKDWLLEAGHAKFFRGKIPSTVRDMNEKKAVKQKGSSRFRTIVSA